MHFSHVAKNRKLQCKNARVVQVLLHFCWSHHHSVTIIATTRTTRLKKHPVMLLIPAAEKDALVSWVKSTTLDDVVFDNSTNTLLSIKSLTICQISCAALWHFCVHHQVSGYKNKSKEVTWLYIIQAVRLKAVCNAMYFHQSNHHHQLHYYTCDRNTLLCKQPSTSLLE